MLFDELPGLYPKTLCAVGGTRIVLLNGLVFLLVALGLGLTVAHRTGTELAKEGRPTSLAYARQYLDRGPPLSDNVKSGHGSTARSCG